MASDIWAIHERPNHSEGDLLIRFSTADPSDVVKIGATMQPDRAFAGLEWMPDGRLLGFANRKVGVEGSMPGLFQLDSLTGSATLIGNTILTETQIVGDIALDPVYWTVSGIVYAPADNDVAEFATGALFNINDGSAYIAGQIVTLGFLDMKRRWIRDRPLSRLHRSAGSRAVLV